MKLETLLIPKHAISLSQLIHQHLQHRRRLKAEAARRHLTALKKERDALGAQMDVALRAMQAQRRLSDQDARLTGQYRIEELTAVVEGEVYDIQQLTADLDTNHRRIKQEEARLARLWNQLSSDT